MEKTGLGTREVYVVHRVERVNGEGFITVVPKTRAVCPKSGGQAKAF